MVDYENIIDWIQWKVLKNPGRYFYSIQNREK